MSARTVQRTWRVAEEDRAKSKALADGLRIPRLAAHLLTLRGIDSVDAGNAFLNPSLADISDPFLLTDMRAAVDRIALARERREPVLVFGDYDVDGIAGTAILIRALQQYGIARCTYGMPSRLIEGYGIAPEHVEAAYADGVTLIITVDNGINAREAAATARRLGVDLIVTDHHQLEGPLPEAAAVVNPKREPESYPGRQVAGAAVAFRLAHALTGGTEDLDLVALGTVADIVPLRRENRVFVALGLQDMVRRRRVGIVELARVAGTPLEEVTSEKIAFQLAPRLNAAGRLGDGLGPLELMLTDSPEVASRLAAELNRANEERRSIEKAIADQAVEEIEATIRTERYSIVLARRGWHAGVIGVVASRLLAAYHLPVVMIAIDEDGQGRGSGRSMDEFDMVSALSVCKEHLVRFGGHSAAAGLTIQEDAVGAFRAAFEREAARRLSDVVPVQVIAVDALVSFSEIDPNVIRSLERLAPFGCMNPAPIFCTCGVSVLPGSCRELRGGHARFTVQQGPAMFEAIGFNMAGDVMRNVGSHPVDIAFTPQFNTWRGETTIQFVLKDIRA